MQTEMTRVSENGRIVIPAAFRAAMGLKGGETVSLSLDEMGLHIQTKRQQIARAQAMVREYLEPGRSLADELIAERRMEAKREAERG